MDELVWRICCFTGHRHLPTHRLNILGDRLARAVRIAYRRGVREFRAGGAVGFDTLAALTVLDLKEEKDDVRLCLYLPCREQDAKWCDLDQSIYADILSRADEIVYVSERYHRGCMHARNRALVNGSDVCIAFCNEESGGSAYTVQYAKEKGLAVLNLGSPTHQ